MTWLLCSYVAHVWWKIKHEEHEEHIKTKEFSEHMEHDKHEEHNKHKEHNKHEEHNKHKEPNKHEEHSNQNITKSIAINIS